MVKFREQIFEVPPKLDGRNVAVEEQAKPLSLKLPNPNWAAKRFSVGPGHRVHHPNRHLRTSSCLRCLKVFSARGNFLQTVQHSKNTFSPRTASEVRPPSSSSPARRTGKRWGIRTSHES